MSNDAVNAIDYELDHLFDISIDFNKYPICQGNIDILAQIFHNGQYTKTIVDYDKKPIAIISGMLIHDRVACIHIVPSKEAHKLKRKSFISAILRLRKELEHMARKYKLRRIETLTIDDEKHNAWMRRMGFLYEGTKKMYGLNGEDYNMWSRLWV